MSWSYGCGDTYGVYTSVKYHLDWIKEITKSFRISSQNEHSPKSLTEQNQAISKYGNCCAQFNIQFHLIQMETVELIESGLRIWSNDRFELKIEFDRYWVIKPVDEKSICYTERNGNNCPKYDAGTKRAGDWWCLQSGIWKKAETFSIQCNL